MSTFRPWFDDPPRRSDQITIPVLWLTFILSLLLHVGLLWYFLSVEKPKLLPGLEAASSDVPITVKLAQAPGRPPPPTPSAPPPPPPAAAPTPARPSPPRVRVPPIIAALPRVPSTERIPMLPEPVVPVVPSPRPPEPLPQDLSAYIASQRRARGEAPSPPSANPADDREARRDRAIAANLASANTPQTLGESKQSGGIFQITYIGYDDAEFTFFGYLNNIKRRATQKIEVRKGDNANIRIAIVRRMIDIIRQYEQEDFTWKSERLGHVVTLSARPQDTAALEEFIMKDFFDTPGVSAR